MEWKEVRLGDIADVQTGPFGSQLHKSDYIAEGIPCIMPTNIGSHLNFIVDGIAHVSEVDANRLSRHLTEFGDIIYARRGDIEKCAYVTTNEEKWLCGTGCLKIRCNNGVNSRFIAYQLSTAECKKWITGNAVGTTMLNLSKGILSNLPLLVPSHEDQRRIASILSSLDRKIELNNKINADLEEMAQAIFKNWFVDFEPFKDGKFVDSELGMIPEGWKVGTLGDITNNKSAKVKERNDVKVLSPVTSGELVLSEEYFTKQVFSSSIAKYKIVNKGDFAYNPARVNIGSLGRNEFDFYGCVSPVYVVFSVLEGYENYFDLFRKTDFFKDSVASLAIGGVRQSLSYDDLSLIETIIPSKNIVEKFNNLYNQMKKTIKANKLENSRLSLLRDTLLPRLMSGELEVPE
ncbi:restriction endonuclease subunit S [Segatella copri]|uniref:Restriction endonuclease subunit S n=1 Tax=Segatella copri TaxID=165179 RepID=A0A3R6IKR3_9BACT|nr:restriction endonuclease subunit S [Segatella copri]